MDILITNLVPILLGLAIITAIILLVIRGQVGKLKQLALHLVTIAEQEYGDGTGKIKFSAVAEALYEKLPSFIGVFISAKTIETIIEWAVTEMKEFLADNEDVATRLLSKEPTKVTKATVRKPVKK